MNWVIQALRYASWLSGAPFKNLEGRRDTGLVMDFILLYLKPGSLTVLMILPVSSSRFSIHFS